MDKLQQFKKATLKRSFLIDAKPNLEDRTVELAFSSDVELVRWAGMAEVLSHAPGAVDLTRLNNGGPLLFNHDINEVIGVVENARIDADGRGRAVVRFSRSDDGEEVWQDVQDGILRSVSVGYRVNEIVLTGEHDGIEVYTATKWEPYEISIVTVPADITVGLGRSMEEEVDEETPAEVLETKTPEAETLLKEICEPTPPPISLTTMSETKSDGIAAEKSRSDIILNAGEKYNEVALASEFVRSGKSADEFKTALLEKVQARQSSVQTSAAKIGLTDKESRDFSMVKLFRSLSEPQNSKAREEAAFELEACAAAADRSGRSLKGTLIPFDVLSVRNTNTISDTIATTGYTGTGKNLVATNLLSGSFVDALRNKTVLMQKATVLAGLVGNVDIPKQTTKTSATWIGEDSSAVQSDIDFGLISLRPKTLAARSEITRRLLNQSSLGVEALVRDDLAKSLALALDYAGFYGDGSSNAPIGINATSGIGFKGFAATNPTFAELVEMETAVALENADVQSMAYIAGAGFRGYAKSTKKFASTGADATIWESGNMVNGYEAVTTNQVAAGDVFFGDFSSLICAIFSGVEVIVDPYTNSASGRIRLVSMLDADFGVRRAKSFVVGRID
jgi:HK97 family phage major capsid protein/HK97 family phage prohead protease